VEREMALKVVDPETGEIEEFDVPAPLPAAPLSAQMSLDVALFASYSVPEVMVTVTCSQKMNVKE